MSGAHRSTHTSAPAVPLHQDPGLQPERTTLAWGRTLLAFITAAAVCLRWVSHHGAFVLVLFTVAVCAAAVIYLSQRIRYSRSSSGIAAERVDPGCSGVLGLSFVTVVLGALGIYVVLVIA